MNGMGSSKMVRNRQFMNLEVRHETATAGHIGDKLNRNWQLKASGLILGAALTGCATNTLTGRQQVSLVSDTAVISKSSSMYGDMVANYNKKNKLSTDALLVQRVTDITNRVIDQAVRYRPETAQWKWELAVIDEDTINAFCMPGGKMGIYRGIVEKLQATDDEIAMVMGHEIAHAMAGHGAEKMSVQMATNLAVVLIAAAAGKNDTDRRAIYNLGGVAALAFINLPNSRASEEEADRLGIEFATRAGYNPDAAASLWQKMGKKTGQTSRVDFLSTHPSPAKREENLRTLAQTMREQNFPPKDTTQLGNPWVRGDHNRNVPFSPGTYASSLQPLRLATYIDSSKSDATTPSKSIMFAGQQPLRKPLEAGPKDVAIAAPAQPAVVTVSTVSAGESVSLNKSAAPANEKPAEPKQALTSESSEQSKTADVATGDGGVSALDNKAAPAAPALVTTVLAPSAEVKSQSIANSMAPKEPEARTAATGMAGLFGSLVAMLPQAISAPINRALSPSSSQSSAEKPSESSLAVAPEKSTDPSQNPAGPRVLPGCDEVCRSGADKVDVEFHELYVQEQWKKLWDSVAVRGYKSDLNYLYLARSAEALGDSKASKRYYEMAVELSNEPEFSCGGESLSGCQGLDVKSLAGQGSQKRPQVD